MRNPGEKTLDRLYNVKDKTLQQIADIYGVTRECVRQWMEECDLARRKRGRKSSFDESILKEAYQAYLAGVTETKLLKRYHISPGTLYKLIHKKDLNPELEKKYFKGKTKNFSVRFTRKQFNSIKFWSNKLGISRNRLLRIVMRRYFDWYNSLSEEEKKKCIEVMRTSDWGKIEENDEIIGSLIKRIKKLKIGEKNADKNKQD